MKRIIGTFCILMVSLINANACEICGCGVGTQYIGLVPQFSHHFFGIRYRFSSFNTRLKDAPSEFSKDFYQTVELWGGLNIGKRWQILAFLPYNIVYQHSDEGITRHQGPGDITVMGNYKLVDKISGTQKMISQQLWLGAGVKLATGKFSFDAADPDLASIANSQVGSGSTDFLLNAHYNLRVNRLGISSNLSYKINTANKDEYVFGNQLAANSFVFYTFPKAKSVWMPNIGVLYEHSEANDLQHSKIALTGGHVIMASGGLEITVNRVSLGFNIQLPLAQNFAEGQTKTNLKGMIHTAFSF